MNLRADREFEMLWSCYTSSAMSFAVFQLEPKCSDIFQIKDVRCVNIIINRMCHCNNLFLKGLYTTMAL